MNVYGELTSAQIENRTADPTLSAVRKGRLWWRTDLSTLKVDLGGSAETFAMLAAIQTFTNKSIDADTNTLTNIANAAIKAAAGIVYSKLSLASSVKASDMNSLASLAGDVLTADGAGGAAYSTPAVFPDESYQISNLSIACSVAANALTIAIKDKAGNNPSGSSQIKVGMRSSTAATGTYNQRSIAAALSLVVSSGSTLGHVSGVTEHIYVYLIDNAGTLELAVSTSNLLDTNSVQTTTAEGGAGAADDRYTIYSTAARASVPIRLIGRLKSNQVTAGTWALVPTEIATIKAPYYFPRSEVWLHTGNGHGSTNNKIRRWTTTVTNVGSAITYADSATLGGTFTINEPGLYYVRMNDFQSGSNFYYGVTVNSGSLSTTIDSINPPIQIALSGNVAGDYSGVSLLTRLNPGDIVRGHTNGAVNGADGNTNFRIIKLTD